jgi:predicted double-glycine peptidase
LISSRRSRLWSIATVALPLLGGCAAVPVEWPHGSLAPELTDVPFFPQTEYQCGPAALATLLADAGADVTAEDLVDEVYVEGLHGSLQAELLGATRRHGFIPYVIEPDAAALVAEVAAGRPVLVLQNFGLPRVPVWHYAVVVGADADHVVLRSGTEQRRRERTKRFMRSWRGGERWAFVALAPGTLAATATPAAYVHALGDAERVLPMPARTAAADAALDRWPDDSLVLFASAATAFERGNLDRSTALYRKLLAGAPDDAAARNNLANVLAARGCTALALEEARTALAGVETDSPLYPAIEDTVTELERAGTEDSAATCP